MANRAAQALPVAIPRIGGVCLRRLRSHSYASGMALTVMGPPQAVESRRRCFGSAQIVLMHDAYIGVRP
jgi:hypothetical protein